MNEASEFLPRDAVIFCGSEGAMVEAESEFPLNPRVLWGRDVVDENDLRTRWNDITARQAASLCLDMSEEVTALIGQLGHASAVNSLSTERKGKDWVNNLLDNLPLLLTSPTIMGSDNVLSGVPAFIVGAGPSLDRNGHLVEECMQRGLVIAINSASLAVPHHMQVSLESNDLSAKLADNEAIKCYSMIAHPNVTRRSRFCPIYSGELASVQEELLAHQRLATCGSSTTAAVTLAMRLGCSPIVLVGQDMAYTDDRVYASSTGFDDATKINGDKLSYDWRKSAALPRESNPLPTELELLEVPGWHCGTVKTTHFFAHVSHWMSGLAGRGHQLFNATEGGINIPGWVNVTLQDALHCHAPRSSPMQIPLSRCLSVGALRKWIGSQLAVLDPASPIWTAKACPLVDPWCAAATRTVLNAWREYPHSLDREQEEIAARCGWGALQSMLDVEFELLRNRLKKLEAGLPESRHPEVAVPKTTLIENAFNSLLRVL